MMATENGGRARGFTMLEMLVSMGIFLLICASAFTLLGVSQQRYQTESQVLTSFEEAQLGLDQIVRDVNDSGYPPANQFQVPSADYNGYATSADTPVAWSPGYPGTPPAPPTNCYLGGGGTACNTPGPDGIFIETNPTQTKNSPVQYIRYKLVNTTLYRGVFNKVSGVDPYVAFPDSQLVPFVQNVMNQASAAQIAQINAAYPNMFPGGAQVPVFTYLFDTPSGPLPSSDPRTFGVNVPQNIRSITITLIVQTPTPDPQTGQFRVIELTGRGSRINSFN
jgi:prepilin-type N-terminal cleavage/methylation domain-containing protein